MGAATTDSPDTDSGSSTDKTKVKDNTAPTTGSPDGVLQTATNLAAPENSKLINQSNNPAQFIERLSGVLPAVAFVDNTQAEKAALQKQGREGDGDDGSGDKTPPNVKKDDQGRVIEVDYPNNTSRKFGYDDQGNLNSITQPDGRTIVLKDGKWQYENSTDQRTHEDPSGGGSGSGRSGEVPGAHAINGALGEVEPDIINPIIGSDGTFTYQTRDGGFTNINADGTQSRVKDASIVRSDIDNNVTEIDYPDGTRRQFGYKNGKLDTVTENGQTYTVKDGQLYDADGKPTGIKNPDVTSDGTYRFQDTSGNKIDVHSNLTRDVHKPDGSTVRSDKNGNVTEIDYADGSSRTFGYDDKGHLNKITDRDGKVYNFEQTVSIAGIPIGTWKDADGKPAPFLLAKADGDGTFTQTFGNGRVERQFTTGASQKTDGSVSDINDAAQKIHDAATKGISILGQNFPTPDKDQINQILDRLSTADREQLMRQYEQLYGVSLKDDLRNRLGDGSAHAQLLLNDADLRTAGLTTFSDPEARAMWDRTIDSFERRAKAQGMSEADIARHEQEYLQYLQSHASEKSGADLVRDVQKVMAKNAKPEMIEVSTDHFNIKIENFGDVTPQQVEQLKKDLEEAYKKYQDYYGVDINTVMGRKYEYQVISPEELGWSGGGTYSTVSAITNDVLPGLTSTKPGEREGALNILYHELANGWATLYATKNDKAIPTPGWYGAEGQAGFYKSHLLLDQGYTASVESEYQQALRDFQRYQDDVKAGRKPDDGENSAASHVIIESLYQKFGYGPMQEIDKKIQSGELQFDPNASPEENNGRLIYALAQATHTNLLDFMDKYNIPVTDEWRQKIQALGYADSGMQLATTSVPGARQNGTGDTNGTRQRDHDPAEPPPAHDR
jgi:YD repeat-containing protein